jgi:hypothetical protein
VRRRGFPHFLDNRLTDGAEVVSLMGQPAALYPQVDSWYSFLLEAVHPRGTIRLMPTEKSNELIGNRNGDLPTCSTVLRSTTLPILRAIAIVKQVPFTVETLKMAPKMRNM